MEIFKWKQWNDMREDRISPITLEQFEELLTKECHNFETHVLYKKIYKPEFDYGFFSKARKKIELYNVFENNNLDKTYPTRNNSLVCFKEKDNEILGEGFIILPYKNSLFTIDKINNERYINKGYWSNNIKWYDAIKNADLWTDSNCLLIKESLWINIINKLKI